MLFLNTTQDTSSHARLTHVVPEHNTGHIITRTTYSCCSWTQHLTHQHVHNLRMLFLNTTQETSAHAQLTHVVPEHNTGHISTCTTYACCSLRQQRAHQHKHNLCMLFLKTTQDTSAQAQLIHVVPETTQDTSAQAQLTCATTLCELHSAWPEVSVLVSERGISTRL